MEKNEIDALIRLLDDNDTEIFEQIRSRLIDLGKDVIPMLENAWSKSMDALMQQRIESIIHRIQLSALQNEIRSWIEKGCVDLVKGALLIARYQYPDLDEKSINDN